MSGYANNIIGIIADGRHCTNKVKIVFNDDISLESASRVPLYNKNRDKYFYGCHFDEKWKLWVNKIHPNQATPPQRTGWAPRSSQHRANSETSHDAPPPSQNRANPETGHDAPPSQHPDL